MYLESIKALRDLNTAGGDSVLVGSYYAPISPNASIITNGGGTFVFDANDLDSADNGGTIIVSNMWGQRWKRQVEGSLTPAMFGAKGDGMTSTSNTDTDAWQRTIAYAETLLLAGQSNVVIDGQGKVYGIKNQLVHDKGTGLVICNARFKALNSPNWSNTGTVGYLSSQIPDLIRTNNGRIQTVSEYLGEESFRLVGCIV